MVMARLRAKPRRRMTIFVQRGSIRDIPRPRPKSSASERKAAAIGTKANAFGGFGKTSLMTPTGSRRHFR
jgi:hypothetical protein